MVYPMVKWHIYLLLGNMLSGLAAPMEADSLRAAGETEHMATDLEALSHALLRADAPHEMPSEGIAQVGEGGLQALLEATSGETAPHSLTDDQCNTNPSKVELQGNWAKLTNLNWKTRILAIPLLTEVRNYPRHGEELALGKEEYKNRKNKAFSDIRSLYTLACDHAKEWHVCFQEHLKYNEAAFVSAVEAQLQVIYEDSLLDPEPRALAEAAYQTLRTAKDAEFGLLVAQKFTKMMDTILSAPLSRPSQKSPFITNAPDFLRNLGQLEQAIPYHSDNFWIKHYSDEFWLSISNTWIRKLLTSASQEIRERNDDLEASASLNKIVGDPRITQWISAEAKRAVDYLDKLKEYLASPDSPIKPLPTETTEDPPSDFSLVMEMMGPQDELLDPQSYLQPEVSAWLLEPDKLRMCSEADMVAYMADNCKWAEPIASQLMPKLDELQKEAAAEKISDVISKAINQIFNKRQPTVWLVFFSWVAKKAHKNEAFHAALENLEKPLFQIFKLHRDRRPIQEFGGAVEELIFEARSTATLAPGSHEVDQDEAMHILPIPQDSELASPIAQRRKDKQILEFPPPPAWPVKFEPQILLEPFTQQPGPSSLQFPSEIPSLQPAIKGSLVQLHQQSGENASLQHTAPPPLPHTACPPLPHTDRPPLPHTARPPLPRKPSVSPLPPLANAVKAEILEAETELAWSSRGDKSTHTQSFQPQGVHSVAQAQQKLVPPEHNLRKRLGDPLDGPIPAPKEFKPTIQGDITLKRISHSPPNQPGSSQQEFSGEGAHRMPLTLGTENPSGEIPLDTSTSRNLEQVQQPGEGVKEGTSGSKRLVSKKNTELKSKIKKEKDW